MASSTSRVTFSLPCSLAKQLRYVSGRLSITQSALVTQLLSEALPVMQHLLAQVPDDLTEVDAGLVRRLRGESVALINQRIDAFRSERGIDDEEFQ